MDLNIFIVTTLHTPLNQTGISNNKNISSTENDGAWCNDLWSFWMEDVAIELTDNPSIDCK